LSASSKPTVKTRTSRLIWREQRQSIAAIAWQKDYAMAIGEIKMPGN